MNTPRMLSGLMSDASPRSMGKADGAPVRTARFVTETHALGGPGANPRALVIAAAIAVALVLIGRRLSE